MGTRGPASMAHGQSPIVGDDPPSPLARSTRLLETLEFDESFAPSYGQDDAFMCVQDLLQISIDRSDDTRLLYKVVSGEVKIDVDAANKVISHCTVREDARVGREDMLLSSLKDLKEGKLADTLLAFNEIDQEERVHVAGKSPRETRAFYERNPSSSARASGPHYPPPPSASRSNSNSTHPYRGGHSALSSYGAAPSPPQSARSQRTPRRPVTTQVSHDNGLGSSSTAGGGRRARTTAAPGPRRRARKKQAPLPGYGQFKSSNTNARVSPYGRAAPLTLPALGRTGQSGARGGTAKNKRRGQSTTTTAEGSGGNGRGSARGSTSHGSRAGDRAGSDRGGVGRTAPRASSAHSARSQTSASGRRSTQRDHEDADGGGEPGLDHTTWKGELDTYMQEVTQYGGVQSRGGEPYAVLLGYVVKARTAFHEALQEVDQLAAQAYAAEFADTVSSTKKRGAPRSENIEEYYSLVEYVELREATARDERERAARQAHEEDASARRIQGEYRRHLDRERRKQREDLEYSAAVTIQKVCRGYLVRKQRMSAVRLAQLGKKYKLAKIKLWVHRIYIKAAEKRYKTIELANVRRWRIEHESACKYQARHVGSLEQNAKQSVAVATQLSQWRAAIKMQIVSRAFLAKCAVVNRQKATVRIQSFIRMWLAKERVFWMRQYATLRAERKRKSDWLLSRQRHIVVYPLENEMLLRHILLTKEHHYAEREMRKEKQRFEQSWHVWCKQMKKFCLNQPLREEWAPQLDSTSGTTFYVNTVTGQRQTEHPHMLYVQINREKSRLEAQAKFEEQVKPLLEYQDELVESQRRNKYYFEQKISRRRMATARLQEQSRTNVNVDNNGTPLAPFDSNAVLFVDGDGNDLTNRSEEGEAAPASPLAGSRPGSALSRSGSARPGSAKSGRPTSARSRPGSRTSLHSNASHSPGSPRDDAASARGSPTPSSPRAATASPSRELSEQGTAGEDSATAGADKADTTADTPAVAAKEAAEPAPVSDDDDNDSDAPDLNRERVEEEV